MRLNDGQKEFAKRIASELRDKPRSEADRFDTRVLCDTVLALLEENEAQAKHLGAIRERMCEEVDGGDPLVAADRWERLYANASTLANQRQQECDELRAEVVRLRAIHAPDTAAHLRAVDMLEEVSRPPAPSGTIRGECLGERCQRNVPTVGAHVVGCPASGVLGMLPEDP